jgi:serine/threonine-protein kinase HipA
MPTETLIAVASGRRMGQLEHAAQQVTFTYDSTWQSAAGAYPLSLNLPLETQRHRRQAVLPFLWGLLPDNQDVLEQWGRRFGVSPRNPFRLLHHVGEDCAGAVQFVRPEREREVLARLAPEPTWLTEGEVAERLRQLGRDAGAGRLATDLGQFSLAGVQRKTALYWDGRRWGVPRGAQPTTHILKPAMPAFEGHPENEHVCLELARALGIPAAISHVQSFEDQSAIVVTRFDRVQTDAGYQRIHQEDMCQACGVLPELKYENQGGPSAERILAIVREASQDAEADVQTFVRAFVLQWLIGGTDAHAKNYAVLFAGGRRIRLAPLYDVASALPYYPAEQQRLKLAMQVGGEYLLLRINRRRWESFAKSADVPVAEVIDTVRTLCDDLPDAYATVQMEARAAGLSHPILDTLEAQLVARAKACRGEV